MREARKAFAAARSVCNAQWPTTTRDTALPRANCVSNAEETTILPASGDFADLVQQRIAFRNALAAKVASGEVSPPDAELQFAQYNTELSNAAHAREAQMATEQAERIQAASSSLAATAALMEAARPSYAPPAQMYSQPTAVRTNCYSNGSFTNCTSQ
jgi:hypothetical protein